MNVVYKRRKPKHTHDPRDNREREGSRKWNGSKQEQQKKRIKDGIIIWALSRLARLWLCVLLCRFGHSMRHVSTMFFVAYLVFFCLVGRYSFRCDGEKTTKIATTTPTSALNSKWPIICEYVWFRLTAFNVIERIAAYVFVVCVRSCSIIQWKVSTALFSKFVTNTKSGSSDLTHLTIAHYLVKLAKISSNIVKT